MEEDSLEPLALVEKGDAIRFEVHAHPRSSKSAVRGVRGRALDVALAAPPIDGLANEELVATLAAALCVGKQRIRLVRGASGKRKIIEIRDLPAAEIRARLVAAAERGRQRR